MIITPRDLELIRKTHSDRVIVYAGGVFDLIHLGHIHYFRDLKQMGDILVIAVSCDSRVRECKGNERPILLAKERVQVLDAIKYIDYCLIAPERKTAKGSNPSLQVIEKLHPDIFVSADKGWASHVDKLENIGVKFVQYGYKRKINSTSRIIKKIKRSV